MLKLFVLFIALFCTELVFGLIPFSRFVRDVTVRAPSSLFLSTADFKNGMTFEVGMFVRVLQCFHFAITFCLY